MNEGSASYASTDGRAQLALFVMTKKGLNVLEAITERLRECVELVVTARDPAVEKDYTEEILAHCKAQGIPVYDRADHYVVRARYAFAASWRWLLHLPHTRLIVFHDSLLPRYRGFNPLVSSLINGETEIGVTALFASESYDCGAIVDHAAVEISYPMKIEEAIDTLGVQYRILAQRLASDLCRGKELLGRPQDESVATYSLWRDEEDYRIRWSSPAECIKRFVDAVGWPYRGASTLVNGQLARVRDVAALPDVAIENRTPGKVIFLRDGHPVVVCGSGLVEIKELSEETSGRSLLPFNRLRSRFH